MKRQKRGNLRAIAGPDPDRIQLLGFLVATIIASTSDAFEEN